MPTSRKGSSASHTSGYNTSASRATGQQRIKSRHQRRNLITLPTSPFKGYVEPERKVPAGGRISRSAHPSAILFCLAISSPPRTVDGIRKILWQPDRREFRSRKERQDL